MTPSSDLEEIRSKLHLLADDANSIVINRWEVIETAIIALLCRYHMFLLGPPGIAKTYLTNAIFDRIGGAKRARCFFGKLTPLEKVVGPLRLTKLAEDRYVYNLTGRICDAHIVELDELWKASVALANELLEILNERRFMNDGVYTDIPLREGFAIAMSNEMPQDTGEGLAAAYDRFLFRMVLDPISDTADLERMARLRLSQGRRPTGAPIIQWPEVRAAQAAVDAMPVSDAAINAWLEILTELSDRQLSPSNRRQAESVSVIQARAWYDGADEAQPHHLEDLIHVFWDDPAQRRDVERIVFKVCSPLRREAVQLRDQVVELAEQFDDAMKKPPRDPARLDAVHEINGKLGDAEAAAKAIIAKAAGGGAKRTADDTLRQILALGDRVLTEGLNFDSRRARALRSGS